MTLQDLKQNREYIINTITEKVGSDLVKPVMEQMVKGLSCCDSLNELIDEAIYMTTEFEFKEEKGKLASIMAKAHEGEEYDMLKKEWVKKY